MKNNDIQALRPYFPLRLEDDLPDQIVLKNDHLLRWYFLIIALIELISHISSPSLFHILFFISLIIAFVFSFFVEDPEEIIVSSLGITLTIKFLFFPFKRFLSKDKIQSTTIFLKKKIFGGYIGYMKIHCISSRTRKIIKLSRRNQSELLEDLNIISAKISHIFSIPEVKRS